MSHTPGPWTAGKPFEGHVVGGDRFVCSTMGHYDGRSETREENVANAHLIAAAPDLLASLRVLVGVYVALVNSGDCGNWNPETEPQVIEARAAITKAEGK